MYARILELLRRQPLPISGLFLFSLYMTFVYCPYDLLVKPFLQDVESAREVWLGYMLRGWAAKLTEPLHWAIYAAIVYGFYRDERWVWPLASLYVAQVAIASLVWTLLYATYGPVGHVLAVVVTLLFGALAVQIWRARPA